MINHSTILRKKNVAAKLIESLPLQCSCATLHRMTTKWPRFDLSILDSGALERCKPGLLIKWLVTRLGVLLHWIR